MDNRAGEMQVFVAVVEAASFSAAARRLLMTPSTVSKLIARLEGRLGVRLVERSTRRLSLTTEGHLYHQRAVRMLADLDGRTRARNGQCRSERDGPHKRLRRLRDARDRTAPAALLAGTPPHRRGHLPVGRDGRPARVRAFLDFFVPRLRAFMTAEPPEEPPR
jgi:DNA-binding transcriptional LysR family regulator